MIHFSPVLHQDNNIIMTTVAKADQFLVTCYKALHTDETKPTRTEFCARLDSLQERLADIMDTIRNAKKEEKSTFIETLNRLLQEEPILSILVLEHISISKLIHLKQHMSFKVETNKYVIESHTCIVYKVTAEPAVNPEFWETLSISDIHNPQVLRDKDDVPYGISCISTFDDGYQLLTNCNEYIEGSDGLLEIIKVWYCDQ